MKKVYYVCILASVFIWGSCKTNNSKGLFGDGDCPFERIDWMKVTTTYDKNTVIDLSAKIGAAASVDSSILKKIVDGKADIDFSDSLSKTLHQITKDSVEVSKEFYDEYLRQRVVVCQLWTFGKDKNFKEDKEFMKRLEDQYFEITKNFGKIQEDIKKNLN